MVFTGNLNKLASQYQITKSTTYVTGATQTCTINGSNLGTGADVYYDFTVTQANTRYWFDTVGSAYDTTLYLIDKIFRQPRWMQRRRVRVALRGDAFGCDGCGSGRREGKLRARRCAATWQLPPRARQSRHDGVRHHAAKHGHVPAQHVAEHRRSQARRQPARRRDDHAFVQPNANRFEIEWAWCARRFGRNERCDLRTIRDVVGARIHALVARAARDRHRRGRQQARRSSGVQQNNAGPGQAETILAARRERISGPSSRTRSRTLRVTLRNRSLPLPSTTTTLQTSMV